MAVKRSRLRADRNLASFLDPGPFASFLRVGGTTWVQEVGLAVERLSSPTTRPELILRSVMELLYLARSADECAAEILLELNHSPGVGK